MKHRRREEKYECLSTSKSPGTYPKCLSTSKSLCVSEMSVHIRCLSVSKACPNPNPSADLPTSAIVRYPFPGLLPAPIFPSPPTRRQAPTRSKGRTQTRWSRITKPGPPLLPCRTQRHNSTSPTRPTPNHASLDAPKRICDQRKHPPTPRRPLQKRNHNQELER